MSFLSRHKNISRIITFLLILAFLCQDVALAQSISRSSLQSNSPFDEDPERNDVAVQMRGACLAVSDGVELSREKIPDRRPDKIRYLTKVIKKYVYEGIPVDVVSSITEQIKRELGESKFEKLLEYFRNQYGEPAQAAEIPQEYLIIQEVIAALAINEFLGQRAEDLLLIRDGQTIKLSEISPRISRIVIGNTLQYIDWRLTDKKDSDLLVDVLSDLRSGGYFKEKDLLVPNKNVLELIVETQGLIHNALNWLYKAGLIRDGEFCFNISSGGAISCPFSMRNHESNKIYFDLSLASGLIPSGSEINDVRDMFDLTQNELAIKMLYTIITNSVQIDELGLSDIENEIMRNVIALNYIVELCSAEVLDADDFVNILILGGVRDEAQIDGFIALVESARRNNFYSVRIREIIDYVLRFSDTETINTQTDKRKIADKIKQIMDRKKNSYYLSSFVRSGAKLLDNEKSRKKTAGKIDKLFEESLSEIRHVPKNVRYKKHAAHFWEEFTEKIVALKELRHPVELVKKIWNWAITKGGYSFAAFITCYSLFEDYILSPLLYSLGWKLAALLAYWLHGEPIAIYLYFLVRKFIHNNKFKKGIPRTEFEALSKRLRDQMEEEEFRNKLTTIFGMHKNYGQFIMEYFYKTACELYNSGGSSTLEKIGQREEAVKVLGRILAKKKKLDKDGKDKKIIEKILELTDDPDPWVRKVSVGALGKIYKHLEGDFLFEARTRLSRMLDKDKEKESIVRAAAARSFARLGTRRNIPRLADIAINKNEDRWVRIYALLSIGLIAEDNRWGRETGSDAKSPIKVVVDALLKLARPETHDVELRSAALEVLGRLEFATEEMMSVIREALFDARIPTVREYALRAYARKALTLDSGRHLHEFKNTLFVYLYSQDDNMRYFCARLLEYMLKVEIPKVIKDDIKLFLRKFEKSKISAKGADAKPIVFVSVDDLFTGEEERRLNTSKVEACSKILKENGHSVFYTRNWLLDRSNTRLNKDGSISIYEQFDVKGFTDAFTKLRHGLPVRIPWIDFKRGKRARERTISADKGGVIVVMGFKDEVELLSKNMTGDSQVLSIGEFVTDEEKAEKGWMEKSYLGLRDKLNAMIENNPAVERNILLAKLGVKSLSEITTRFDDINDLRQYLIQAGIAETELVMSKDNETMYLTGKNIVTIFSYKRPVKEDPLIAYSGEAIGDICLDSVTHPDFITIVVTDNVRSKMTKPGQIGKSDVADVKIENQVVSVKYKNGEVREYKNLRKVSNAALRKGLLDEKYNFITNWNGRVFTVEELPTPAMVSKDGSIVIFDNDFWEELRKSEESVKLNAVIHEIGEAAGRQNPDLVISLLQNTAERGKYGKALRANSEWIGQDLQRKWHYYLRYKAQDKTANKKLTELIGRHLVSSVQDIIMIGISDGKNPLKILDEIKILTGKTKEDLNDMADYLIDEFLDIALPGFRSPRKEPNRIDTKDIRERANVVFIRLIVFAIAGLVSFMKPYISLWLMGAGGFILLLQMLFPIERTGTDRKILRILGRKLGNRIFVLKHTGEGRHKYKVLEGGKIAGRFQVIYIDGLPTGAVLFLKRKEGEDLKHRVTSQEIEKALSIEKNKKKRNFIRDAAIMLFSGAGIGGIAGWVKHVFSLSVPFIIGAIAGSGKKDELAYFYFEQALWKFFKEPSRETLDVVFRKAPNILGLSKTEKRFTCIDEFIINPSDDRLEAIFSFFRQNLRSFTVKEIDEFEWNLRVTAEVMIKWGGYFLMNQEGCEKAKEKYRYAEKLCRQHGMITETKIYQDAIGIGREGRGKEKLYIHMARLSECGIIAKKGFAKASIDPENLRSFAQNVNKELSADEENKKEKILRFLLELLFGALPDLKEYIEREAKKLDISELKYFVDFYLKSEKKDEMLVFALVPIFEELLSKLNGRGIQIIAEVFDVLYPLVSTQLYIKLVDDKTVYNLRNKIALYFAANREQGLIVLADAFTSGWGVARDAFGSIDCAAEWFEKGFHEFFKIVIARRDVYQSEQRFYKDILPVIMERNLPYAIYFLMEGRNSKSKEARMEAAELYANIFPRDECLYGGLGERAVEIIEYASSFSKPALNRKAARQFLLAGLGKAYLLDLWVIFLTRSMMDESLDDSIVFKMWFLLKEIAGKKDDWVKPLYWAGSDEPQRYFERVLRDVYYGDEFPGKSMWDTPVKFAGLVCGGKERFIEYRLKKKNAGAKTNEVRGLTEAEIDYLKGLLKDYGLPPNALGQLVLARTGSANLGIVIGALIDLFGMDRDDVKILIRKAVSERTDLIGRALSDQEKRWLEGIASNYRLADTGKKAVFRLREGSLNGDETRKILMNTGRAAFEADEIIGMALTVLDMGAAEEDLDVKGSITEEDLRTILKPLSQLANKLIEEYRATGAEYAVIELGGDNNISLKKKDETLRIIDIREHIDARILGLFTAPVTFRVDLKAGLDRDIKNIFKRKIHFLIINAVSGNKLSGKKIDEHLGKIDGVKKHGGVAGFFRGFRSREIPAVVRPNMPYVDNLMRRAVDEFQYDVNETGRGIAKYIEITHKTKFKFLPTKNIYIEDLPPDYPVSIREPNPAKTDPIEIHVNMPGIDVFLVSGYHNGMNAVVRLGWLDDGTPVAVRAIYRILAEADNIETSSDYEALFTMDRLGIGPRVHGYFVDMYGRKNIVMDIIPGDFAKNAGEFITIETFRDLTEMYKRLDGKMPDDFQCYITPQGRLLEIDQSRVRMGKLAYLVQFSKLLLNTKRDIRIEALGETASQDPDLLIDLFAEINFLDRYYEKQTIDAVKNDIIFVRQKYEKFRLKPRQKFNVNNFISAVKNPLTREKQIILALDTSIGNMEEYAEGVLKKLDLSDLGNVHFVRGKGMALAGNIDNEIKRLERLGRRNIQVVLVAKEENRGYFSEFANINITTVNDKKLQDRNYIPIIEILTFALRMSAGVGYAHIVDLYHEITWEDLGIQDFKDLERGNLSLVLHKADPIDPNLLKEIYEEARKLLVSA